MKHPNAFSLCNNTLPKWEFREALYIDIPNKGVLGLKKKSDENKLKRKVQKEGSSKTATSEKSAQLVRQEVDLTIPTSLRSEFNFLKYPFFDLMKSSERDKIEISVIIERDGEKAKIL